MTRASQVNIVVEHDVPNMACQDSQGGHKKSPLPYRKMDCIVGCGSCGRRDCNW